MRIQVVDGMSCPCCGAPEVDYSRRIDPPVQPEKPDSLLNFEWQVRAYKVDNWSKCNWCGAWFDDQGNIDHSGILPGWEHWYPRTQEQT